MVNQTILSGENILLPHIGILLSSGLVLIQQIVSLTGIFILFF